MAPFTGDTPERQGHWGHANTTVPDGTYSINWYCDLEDGSYDATMAYFGGTREPTTLIVPAVIPEEPEVPEPVCTGSACLPTGSFGF